MNAPVVSIQGLCVWRGAQRILNGIDWRVRAGEHWVMLGANGSGKTSLLSCLTGYLTPSSGKIEVLGREYGKTDWRDLRLEIGLVSSSIRQMIQDDQLAIEVVASGRTAELNRWRPTCGSEKAAALEALAQVECADRAKRPWAYLSQGERQRVLIGRALVAQHRLLILDEPCAGLDPVARERFLMFLERLANTVSAPNLILVTHHVEEILPCFRQTLILRAGSVLYDGPTTRGVTSIQLSAAFDFPLQVRRRSGRYALGLNEGV
ncbi:MAG: ATP-binding cassette domain-containing protein [Verrucomicrobia bacterium]|nr:ATP-binding cassette domain-containing protein [Verrucomicrobiota bacterium]